MYALCDCNNFFVSCERVFRPDLEGKPVVVLSGNDGCVVSRSNEAKKLGIRMGTPFFLLESRLAKYNITAFSSNFALYGDLSSRVMSVLAKHTPLLEQYSIDEAFLHADHMPIEELKPYYEQVVKQVRQWVGIPISIGIAPTKTLAKIASKFAKKYPAYNGVCIIDTEEKRRKALEMTPLSDIWGLGRKSQEKLHTRDLTMNAQGFAMLASEVVEKLLHKPGLMTWKELHGIDCIDISDHSEKQSISQSRTFPTGISDRATLEKALVDFMSYCADKMRRQHSLCQQFIVYAHTSRFAEGEMQVIHQVVTMPVPTAITAELVQHMLQAVRRQWSAHPYKKAGVVLMNLVPESEAQLLLFDEYPRARHMRLQSVIDNINNQHGKSTIKTGAQILKADAQPLSKKERLSPNYTTDLKDIIKLN